MVTNRKLIKERNLLINRFYKKHTNIIKVFDNDDYNISNHTLLDELNELVKISSSIDVINRLLPFKYQMQHPIERIALDVIRSKIMKRMVMPKRPEIEGPKDE